MNSIAAIRLLFTGYEHWHCRRGRAAGWLVTLFALSMWAPHSDSGRVSHVRQLTSRDCIFRPGAQRLTATTSRIRILVTSPGFRGSRRAGGQGTSAQSGPHPSCSTGIGRCVLAKQHILCSRYTSIACLAAHISSALRGTLATPASPRLARPALQVLRVGTSRQMSSEQRCASCQQSSDTA